jgi:hypothetical protein
MLDLMGATPEPERVVRDRNLVTGGGVTSGSEPTREDLALIDSTNRVPKAVRDVSLNCSRDVRFPRWRASLFESAPRRVSRSLHESACSLRTYGLGVNRDDLLRALAFLIALEQPAVAREAALTLPPWIDILDLVRAADGLQQLAQALDALRRTTAA